MTNSQHHGGPETGDDNLAPTRLHPGARSALETVRKCIVIFGVFSAVVLATVAVVALAHGELSTFMWVRSGLLLLITPVLYRLVVGASQGRRRSFERLSAAALVLPVAIVVVDLIPGVCPVWYAAMQGASAVPLVGVAVMVRRELVAGPFREAS